MKKIAILLFAAAMSFSAMAQNKMTGKSMKMDNCVMMKDGKMMCTMNGKMMPMEKTMTMKNGTKVMADGTVKMKDGKTMMLKDGQSITMNGKLEKMPMKEHMKM